MTSCEQELCPNWNGDLCLCRVIDGPDESTLQQFDTWLADMTQIIEEGHNAR